MDQQTQTTFAAQLARWAEAALQQGRFPFRKMETFPRLCTSQGEVRPPLAFWINRDSFMAGGIVFFPSRHAEESLACGTACADALGLRHFVVWAPREISIWETGPAPREHRGIALPPAETLSAGDFRATLLQVMEELKMLAVTGAVPSPELSPFYLVNLCLSSLEGIIPPLAGAYRIRLGEQPPNCADLSPQVLATRKAALVLLRLLAVVIYDRLPPNVQPEGLERAMQFALDSLPAPLPGVLSAPNDESPLSSEDAVRFHHLFRRLTQLRCGADRHRSTKVLELLLADRGAAWGGAPLPENLPCGPPPLLLLNPDGEHATGAETLECAPPPLLAISALLRELTGRAAVLRQVTEVFALDPQHRPGTVWGSLIDRRAPDAGQRQALAASLRLSWSARRYHLPPRTPRWGWEWLHLLGLCQPGAQLVLNLPDDWLCADYGSAIFAPVREHFTLRRLSRAAEGELVLELTRTEENAAPVLIQGAEDSRTLLWGTLRQSPLAILPLALDLPRSIWELVEGGQLELPTPQQPLPCSEELFLYTRSTLGAFLWNTVSGGAPLPSRGTVGEAICRRGLPLPSPNVLSALGALAAEEVNGAASTAQLDAELARWLGEIPFPAAQTKTAPLRRSPTTLDQSELPARISAEVFRDGLPRFPEQYLYGYLRPPLIDYRFDGPLTVSEEFFDRVSLTDEAGNTLLVEGMDTALALLLAAAAGRTSVALPADRQLTAAILERYVADLKRLRQALVRRAHAEISERRSAEALIDRIWSSKPLPPWSLVGA